MGPEAHMSRSKISTNLVIQHTVSRLSFHLENLTFLTFDIFRKVLVLIRLHFLSEEFFNFTLLIRSRVAHTPLCSCALDNLQKNTQPRVSCSFQLIERKNIFSFFFSLTAGGYQITVTLSLFLLGFFSSGLVSSNESRKYFCSWYSPAQSLSVLSSCCPIPLLPTNVCMCVVFLLHYSYYSFEAEDSLSRSTNGIHWVKTRTTAATESSTISLRRTSYEIAEPYLL